MAISETSIANQALARLGAERLNNIDTDTSVAARHAREHYAQTRDALLRSHWWRFASARATLAPDSSDPSFEYDHQYLLPNDFLAMQNMYDDDYPTTDTYVLEGDKLLTDQDGVNITYIKKVIDPQKFDALFVEVLVLQLAVKLVMPLSQDKALRREVQDELAGVMARARVLNDQERKKVGSSDRPIWNNARY